MRTVELFSGTESFSKVMREYGHTTETYEMERRFNPDHRVDIFTMPVDLVPMNVDILWASPPCEGFSVAAIGKNWNHDNTPKNLTHTAMKGELLLKKTIQIIKEREPKWWFIENPRGKMRRMPYMQEFTRHTVAYCQYGDTRQKPTDIWTNAHWWHPRPMCAPKASCHESAPRGARTGTQGIKTYEDKSRIPSQLFEEILEQMPV